MEAFLQILDKARVTSAHWLISIALVLAATNARAATINVPTGNVAALKDAIAVANSNGEDDVINLGAGFYSLGSVDNFTNGGNALPVITADGGRSLTINGNNAALTRSAPSNVAGFRILQVGPNANVTLNRVAIVQGEMPGPGGGIYNDGGRLTLVECTLASNSVRMTNNEPLVGSLFGGGIHNRGGILALRSCTLRDNQALGTNNNVQSASGEKAFGGAIYNSGGTVTVETCTFSNNVANVTSLAPAPPTTQVAGGAIASSGNANQPARVTIASSTFSGNAASAVNGSTISRVGTTFYVEGPASSSTIEIGSSIIAGQFDPMLSGGLGTIKSHGYNLTAGDGNAFLTATGDLINSDAQLRPLANNGGATATHALGIASPALDRGKRDAVPGLTTMTDQRGAPRAIDYPGFDAATGGDGSDVGAFEKDAPNLVVTTTADHDDGTCNAADCTLREALTVANQQPSRDTIGFAPGISGTINLTSALPIVEKDVEIAGPGADVLTVRRDTGGAYRLFLISNGTSTGPEVAIASLTLTNGEMTGSTSAGGCIYNDFATLRLVRCAVLANAASNGAGIFNFRGTVAAIESTISNNTASGRGGAFFNAAAQGPATITLSNSTVSGNTAGHGAAVHNSGSTGAAKLILNSCTIAENSAPFGTIFNVGPNATNVTVRNTIVKAGASGATIASGSGATVTSQGNNISSDAIGGNSGTEPGGWFSQAGDMRNTDPQLDSAGLKNSGGPTPTLALLSTSPAINAGNSRAPSVDQRGFVRDAIPDIGAFEFAAALPPPPTPTPAPSATPTATPTATPASTPSAKLANIATRLRVETDANVLIGGLIITGTQPKRLIVRAIGPSSGVPGALQNPQLAIYRGDELIAENDNWREAGNQAEIINSGVAPANDLESAVLTTLTPGSYTAIVSGVAGQTGVGSVEAYDLDLNADSEFANISTRGFVQTGDDVMIGGVIVLGTAPQKVILRAIGPSLGIPGQLEDPSLELFDANGVSLTANDNWKDTQQSDIEATTIPPSNDLESAIVASLAPAAYTAIVRGVNDTTGVALIEAYALEQ